MKSLSRRIDLLQVEEKWQDIWEQWGIHRYDWDDDTSPRYSIDTPPPYPSGEFHMGNVLNWTYFDVVARFKRMQGYNVHFPQGWDCHGLPTEVAVEKAKGIRRSSIAPSEFRKLCEDWIETYISIMKKAITRLGCSIDWILEYRTMEQDYIRKIQLSFIQLYENGMIYLGQHPVNWCPRCETAIADAEVKHLKRKGRIYTLGFNTSDGELLIETTRPEYLQACVAVGVHPEDYRYKHLIGEHATVSMTEAHVPIIADPEVDPGFGTGAMMICTYGDKADVLAVARYGLSVINLVDTAGRMRQEAGKYAGMTVKEARRAIVADLHREGFLKAEKSLDQEVSVCWRCDTPVEILTTDQWFMRTTQMTDQVVKAAQEIKWYPDWMKHRLVDWARSLDWDWVLSRQRVFATPIPAWQCKKCGNIQLARVEDLPVDPKVTPPRSGCSCGSNELVPDGSVLDTWFDSSMTCAIHAGWPDRPDWRRLFPASLHPSGQDIIRTWAYYSVVRHLALFEETPYNSVLINPMALGADGRKMSKSLGNFVPSSKIFKDYGADVARQWAAAASTQGTDIPFKRAELEYGKRFITKLWNACRFASMMMQDYDPANCEKAEYRVLDRWILSKLEGLISDVTDALDQYQFAQAIKETRSFVWHILCDEYLEAAKHRLYSQGEEKGVAQQTLYRCVKRILQLLAPVMPHITEEIYHTMYATSEKDTIHRTEWPRSDSSYLDSDAEATGNLIIALIAEMRNEKSHRGIPLSETLEEARIYCQNESTLRLVKQGAEDISKTIRIQNLEILLGAAAGTLHPLQGYPEIGFSINQSP
jgi:valyl-tRNA synthetase